MIGTWKLHYVKENFNLKIGCVYNTFFAKSSQHETVSLELQYFTRMYNNN